MAASKTLPMAEAFDGKANAQRIVHFLSSQGIRRNEHNEIQARTVIVSNDIFRHEQDQI
jgi:hypothetical protein